MCVGENVCVIEKEKGSAVEREIVCVVTESVCSRARVCVCVVARERERASSGWRRQSESHHTPTTPLFFCFFLNFFNFPAGNVCTRGGQREAYPFRVGKLKKLKKLKIAAFWAYGVW